MKSSNLRKLQTLPECFDLFDESDLLLHLLILQMVLWTFIRFSAYTSGIWFGLLFSYIA